MSPFLKIDNDRQITMTAHSRSRCRQRAVRRDALRLIYRYADLDQPQWDGRRRVAVSIETAQDLIAEGINGDLVRRALTTALIMDGQDRLITVLRVDPGARRRPRRNGR